MKLSLLPAAESDVVMCNPVLMEFARGHFRSTMAELRMAHLC